MKLEKEKGIVYTSDLFVEKMVEIFKASEKPSPHLIGVEMEHFLINTQTLNSLRYGESGGQHEMMRKLTQKGWHVILEESQNVLGLEKDGSTLTLEPGGQVELSLPPYGSVEKIQDLYLTHRKEIEEVLGENQALVSLGYHPKSKIGDLPLLPKKRYKMMYDYFVSHGAFCHNMMKGTASTQVSIDYKDELDFRRKFRVANFLSPILADLFEATPIFEGALYGRPNCRLSIWEETDSKRSKLISGSLDQNFGYADYARYLLKIPPIVLLSEGVVYETGNEPLDALLSRFPLTDSDIDHLLSMVFPDVRVKSYIEIRMADALPYPFGFAVPAIIKGIFYNAANLEYFYEISKAYDDDFVRKQNRDLVLENRMMSEDFTRVSEAVVHKAMDVLDKNERDILSRLVGIRAREGSVAQWLRRLYVQDSDAFLKVIVGLEDAYEN
ncbi:glutamate-cysteine ligase family protein [Fusibacter tunisiensis]|uniref:Glutamate--cysteine ligase n=1 Tax=Fusibacter tunisiensis TaxID=1008308 RepID=A0ABS2MTD2_9FIRM|nr:glutamate-cysteine ligase family protein [Fusibacter tunisiensis]MBM7562532.1 glutamate--cysteine ligase [Fusibacter tunisiensis]